MAYCASTTVDHLKSHVVVPTRTKSAISLCHECISRCLFFFLLAVTLQLHHHVLCHIVAAIVGLVPHFLRYNLHRICRQFGAKVGMQIIREFQCACWASRHWFLVMQGRSLHGSMWNFFLFFFIFIFPQFVVKVCVICRGGLYASRYRCVICTECD